MTQKTSEGRRKFLKNSMFGLFGTGVAAKGRLFGAKEREEKKTPKIKGYRTLGRTGFNVSDIGTGFVNEPGLLTAMLEAGVNYIDTAESYGTQRLIGRVIKNFKRQSLFITSKLEVKKDTSKEGFLKRTYKCLEELQTDYIDCMMMHMPETAATLKTEGFHAAMNQLKKEGKVRFVGVSNHGSFWFKEPKETMDKVLLAAAEDGRFDVFLLAYNFLQMDMGERVLEVCRQKNIGTAIMKTNPVGIYYGLKERVEALQKEGKDVHKLYLEGLERYKQKAAKAERFIKKYNLRNPDEIRDAAIRFVLDNPSVNTVCCSPKNFSQMERFLNLSGTSLSQIEKNKLTAYRKGCGELYCRHACGLCQPSCPQQVPINTIMRYNHYFEAQGREKYALAKYAKLACPKADLCYKCQGFCEAACPYGVPIQGMLILAHQRLVVA